MPLGSNAAEHCGYRRTCAHDTRAQKHQPQYAKAKLRREGRHDGRPSQLSQLWHCLAAAKEVQVTWWSAPRNAQVVAQTRAVVGRSVHRGARLLAVGSAPDGVERGRRTTGRALTCLWYHIVHARCKGTCDAARIYAVWRHAHSRKAKQVTTTAGLAGSLKSLTPLSEPLAEACLPTQSWSWPLPPARP